MDIPEILSKVQFYLLVWDRLVIPPFWLILEALGIAAAIHALLNKRDPRAALGWTAACLLFPGFGPFSYLLFGVNRIKSRAQDWHQQGKWQTSKEWRRVKSYFSLGKIEHPFDRESFTSLAHLSESVTRLPLVKGNHFQMLRNGEQAFPQMLEAIHGARQRVFLETYIFETNEMGRIFVEALAKAFRRGVDVRVLVDGAGSHYSRPRIQKLLKKSGIPYALFLPLTLSPRSIHLNLRTHRKILLVDGEVGFTGGMNIGGRHLVEDPTNPNPTQDIHFRIQGPVLAQLQETFLSDWYFARSEIREELHSCESREMGAALARGIIAGPNEPKEKLRWIVNGTFSCAKKKVRIMTPYFIPDGEMTAAIITAALRGVEIELILPEKNNLPYVKWASQALLVELLDYGVKVYYQPPPFAHSKFLVVDDFYSLIGSANLDPRSLILNFEFCVEVYDHILAKDLVIHFEEVRGRSRPLAAGELKERPFRFQLRDSVAKLFSPYI